MLARYQAKPGRKEYAGIRENKEKGIQKSWAQIFSGGNTEVYAAGCIKTWASKGQQKGWTLSSRSLGKRLIKEIK